EIIVKVTVELEHVAQIVSPREAKTAINIGWNIVVAHRLSDCLCGLGRDLLDCQMLPSDSDGFVDQFVLSLEYTQGTLANILRGNRRQFLVSQREGVSQDSIRATFWSGAKVNEVVPIKRSQKASGGGSDALEIAVSFSLAVKVRHFVLSI